MTNKTTYKYMITTTLLIIAALLLQSCNKTTTEPEQEHEVKPSGKIEVVNSSCDELWLNLSVDNIDIPVTVNFYFETKPVNVFLLSSTDTTLYIDSLDAGRNYKGKFTFVIGEEEITTEEYLFTTLDTTSQNYSWETFEFGEHNNSVLYDVAIIDENNIWAVGEIYMKDSSGNYDPHAYNAVHWDGQNWELKKISVLFRGNLITPPLEGVFAFSGNDIWFVGSLPIHGDGNNWTMYDLRTTVNPNLSLSKAWGISSNNIYFVGNNGSIAHWDGSSWKKIESGTEMTLTSIYPYKDEEVLVSGTNSSLLKGVLLKGNKNNGFAVWKRSELVTSDEIFNPFLCGELSAVWVDENKTVYTGGNLMFWYKNGKWDYVKNLPENYIGGNYGSHYRGFIYSITGNGGNDYVIAGDRNTLRHYNGKRWTQLGLPYDPSSPVIWISVVRKGNTIVAVGDKGSKAFIIKLKR